VWHPDPDELTLAALPAEPADPRVAAHVAECALCRGQLDSLRRTVALAADGVDAVDDDAGPPDAVWRAIADELALDDVPEPTPLRPRRRRRVLVPVAAAVVGILAGVTIGWAAFASSPAPSAPTGTVAAQLDPVGSVDPAGAGRVSMVRDDDGQRMEVELTGVDDLAGGDYLQVWLLDPATSQLVAMGGLAPVTGRVGAYRGSFTVPDGTPLTVYGTVDVSIERWDGDPGHSQRSVLRGKLA
jgi:hypothetical protein